MSRNMAFGMPTTVLSGHDENLRSSFRELRYLQHLDLPNGSSVQHRELRPLCCWSKGSETPFSARSFPDAEYAIALPTSSRVYLRFPHADHRYQRHVSKRMSKLLQLVEKLPLLRGVIILLVFGDSRRQHLRPKLQFLIPDFPQLQDIAPPSTADAQALYFSKIHEVHPLHSEAFNGTCCGYKVSPKVSPKKVLIFTGS